MNSHARNFNAGNRQSLYKSEIDIDERKKRIRIMLVVENFSREIKKYFYIIGIAPNTYTVAFAMGLNFLLTSRMLKLNDILRLFSPLLSLNCLNSD